MVAPLIWIGWTAATAIAAALAGCEGSRNTPVSDATGTDTMDDIPSTDAAITTADADATGAQDGYIDTTPPAPLCPQFPLKGAVSLFAEAPCGKDSFINDIDDNGWGSCTNMGDKAYLFHVGTSGIDQYHQILGIPDQVVTGSQLFYSGQHKDQWGFGAWDVGSQNQDQWAALPTLSPGTPSFAKGIDLVGEKIFVVSSNVSFATGSAVYKPGTVFAFDATRHPIATIATSQVNPTSVGHFELGGITYLAVVASGPMNGGDNKSHLDIINPSTLALTQSIPLPFGSLGISGEITIAGGRMAIGSADNSGRIIVLNTHDLSAAPLILTVPEAFEKSGFHFISMARLTPDGKYLAAGNYNTGKVAVWKTGDESSNQAQQTFAVDTNLLDAAGVGEAACINGKLMVSVGHQIMAVE